MSKLEMNEYNIEDIRECLQITPDGRNMFFLRNGEPIPSERSKIGNIIPKDFDVSFYPGDLNEKNADWVIESTISLNELYPSQFFFLIFADPMLKANYSHEFNENDLKNSIDHIFMQLKRFSDYIEDKMGEFPKILVIGTGELENFKGYIDLLDVLEQFPKFSFMSFEGYTGVYFNKFIKERYFSGTNPVLKLGERSVKLKSKFSHEEIKCLEILKALDNIDIVKATSDLIDKFGPTTEAFLSYAPDIICKTKNGMHFTSTTGNARRLFKIHGYDYKTSIKVLNDWNKDIPLSNITDIFSSTLLNLKEGPVALVLIEGANTSNMSNPSDNINSTWADLPYGADQNFIRTITTGKSAMKSPVPYGLNPQAIRTNIFPYGWGVPPINNAFGADSIRSVENIKSIATGSRSMFLHMFSGCDITLEPWVRNRIENGVFIVTNKNQIERKKKRIKTNK
jgi:hypothetical protein